MCCTYAIVIARLCLLTQSGHWLIGPIYKSLTAKLILAATVQPILIDIDQIAGIAD
jgi:hypothetical protein